MRFPARLVAYDALYDRPCDADPGASVAERLLPFGVKTDEPTQNAQEPVTGATYVDNEGGKKE